MNALTEMIQSGFIVLPLTALWFAFFSRQPRGIRIWMVLCCVLLSVGMIA